MGPKTLTAQERNEVSMLGCTMAALDENMRRDYSGGVRTLDEQLMMAMSILSDAQEQQTLGMLEESRQGMNRAKYIIGHVKGAFRSIEAAARDLNSAIRGGVKG